MKKKHVLALCAISGVLFAAIPAAAYIFLLFAGLTILTFQSAVVTLLLKLVWIGVFATFMIPPVIGFCAFQFMVGFAEAMKILNPAAPEKVLSPQEEKELDDKFVRDLPSIGDTKAEDQK